MDTTTLILSENLSPTMKTIFIVIFFVGMAAVVLYKFYQYFEQLYAERHKKPFYVHRYLFKKKLTKAQKEILKKEVLFYNRLNEKHKQYFEHRVATFIHEKNFFGRQDFEITDEVLVLVSSTAVMLTFGFKEYLIELLTNIVVYPSVFYSKANEDYHKGEFNPQFETLVLSWEHYKHGFDIANDNINLGIHEFTHAIHLNSIQSETISAVVFNDGYEELITLLSNNENLRKELIASRYFRDYAYTNQYEFLAVIFETFFETPLEFKQQFPDIYSKTKQMLNFHFAKY